MNLIAIFGTGLLAGGLTCMAVQGGLLAATLAQTEEERLMEQAKKDSALPILSFLISKLLAYSLFGALLGIIGSTLTLSLKVTTMLQFAVAIFMIGTALNILNVHPIFRYFVIQPPRFLTRLIRRQSKSKTIFAPAILGAFTVFIPCGTTQAMMALAIASGNAVSGAAILFAFILGTSPLFFLVGYFATKLGDSLQETFMRIAAVAIILLAIFNFNNAVALTGSNLTIEKMATTFWCTISVCDDTNPITSQSVTSSTISITEKGYSPNELTVKTGSKIILSLKNNGGAGCTQAFTIPSLGIQKIVPIGSSNTISFTAPNKKGDIPFMCSMGMYRGVIHII